MVEKHLFNIWNNFGCFCLFVKPEASYVGSKVIWIKALQYWMWSGTCGLWEILIAHCHIRTIDIIFQAGKLLHGWSISRFGLAVYPGYGVSGVYKALEFSGFLLWAVLVSYSGKNLTLFCWQSEDIQNWVASIFCWKLFIPVPYGKELYVLCFRVNFLFRSSKKKQY